MPVKTPVRLPRNDSGSMPARSMASQDVSSSMRCCGSMARASLGLIPKNAGSNSPASCRNPPRVTYEVPSWSGSGSNRFARSQPRLVGNSEIASLPEVTSSQSCSGVSIPPGSRRPMPTMAMGSLVKPEATAGSASGLLPTSSSRRKAASAARFG